MTTTCGLVSDDVRSDSHLLKRAGYFEGHITTDSGLAAVSAGINHLTESYNSVTVRAGLRTLVIVTFEENSSEAGSELDLLFEVKLASEISEDLSDLVIIL